MPKAETKAKLTKDLIALYNKGELMLLQEVEVVESKSAREAPLIGNYQAWYSEALPIVRQLLPDRYVEFQEQYKLDRRKDISSLTYTISDYLIGLRLTRGADKEQIVDRISVFRAKFGLQLAILISAVARIDSALADIEGTLESGIFLHELDAADDLLKKKHLRASGAIAGVSLEMHLGRVATNHAVVLQKKEPTVSDLNDALKSASAIDVPTWRHIQRLGDIRNLCVHNKDREPTQDEVEDLLRGVRKIIAELF